MAGFDSELDTLFKSSAGVSNIVSRPAPTIVASPANPPTKRKHEKSVSFIEQTKSKKPRNQDIEKKDKVKKSKKLVDGSSDDDNDPAIEDSYRQPGSASIDSGSKNPRKDDSEPKLNLDSDSDPDAPPPVHESLLPENDKPARKQKYVPEGETPEQRDARTIYVGNLPASAANNSARKALQKHILRHYASTYPDLPKPKIESSRFRSVAFKNPTSKLPSDALPTSKPSKPTNPNDHNRQRAAEWRAAQDPDGGKPHKTFQTPAQKKKTAFITGSLHDSASSSASAYVVFAHPPPIEGQEPVWNPVEVAALAVKACNGSLFMDRTLRVDRVRVKGAGAMTDAAEEVEEKGDPRTMVFVGNLDFEVHEDAVRELFEKLVEKERGATKAAAEEAQESSEEEEGNEGDDSEEEAQDDDASDEDVAESEPSVSLHPKPTASAISQSGHRWVKSVRIIRDKETQLGKGFAYVQFYDRVSADEVLAVEQGTIKLAKRKLRIQRCKTLPGATLPKPKTKDRAPPANSSHPPKSDKPSSKPRRTSAPIIPRADPKLGARIRALPKDERKAVKSSDADRVARRLAKKKARVEMERGSRKASGRKESMLGGRTGVKGKVVKGGKGKRERSDKAILKKNVKK